MRDFLWKDGVSGRKPASGKGSKRGRAALEAVLRLFADPVRRAVQA